MKKYYNHAQFILKLEFKAVMVLPEIMVITVTVITLLVNLVVNVITLKT